MINANDVWFRARCKQKNIEKYKCKNWMQSKNKITMQKKSYELNKIELHDIVFHVVSFVVKFWCDKFIAQWYWILFHSWLLLKSLTFVFINAARAFSLFCKWQTQSNLDVNNHIDNVYQFSRWLSRRAIVIEVFKGRLIYVRRTWWFRDAFVSLLLTKESLSEEFWAGNASRSFIASCAPTPMQGLLSVQHF